MQLPLFLSLSQMQAKWKAILDPVLASPTINPTLVTGIALVASTPKVINTGLPSVTGYKITDQDANAVIWRVGPKGLSTLTLQA
jgi:hypothetical protein